MEKRKIYDANPATVLKIKPNKTKTYYIQLYAKLPQVGEFKIFTEKYFLSHENLYVLMAYMFYFGSLVIIILLNSLLAMTLKERIYIYYVGYIASFVLFMFVYSGSSIYFGLAPWHYELHVSSAFATLFLVLFSREFLETKKYVPFLDKSLIAVVALFVLLAILIVMNFTLWYEIMTAFSGLTFVLLIFTALATWRKGHVKAKYYLIIMLIYLMTLSLMAGTFMGVLKNNDLNHYEFLYASFFKILFFSLILANRFHETKEEKIHFQNELIIFKDQNEQILEEKVKMRTIELEQAQERLKDQASKDPLTSLYNRRYFSDMSNKYLATAKRHDQNLSVAMIDIDDFKKVNDNYGHNIGDDVIVMLANSLVALARESDVVARYGGEEFIILFPQTSVENAAVALKKIRAEVEISSVKIDTKNEITITLSIGVSEVINISDTNIEAVIKRADEALYIAKNNGKNQVVIK